LVCQNTLFDGLILEHHYGIVPRRYGDTMMLSQVFVKPFQRSISLKEAAKFLNLGEKGDEVYNTKGKWLDDFTPAELRRFMDYCVNDVELTHALYHTLAPRFPVSEHHVMDLTLRMFMQPRLKLDPTVLAEHLNSVRQRKEHLLNNLPMGLTKDDLMSNPKLAAALEALGVEPPVKTSPTTGKLTYAFAKNDPGFKQMVEDYADDEQVTAVLMARTGVKSTIEETRTERLLDIANRTGKFRVPLRYYGAHTGRYGGMEKINAQNLPRVDKSRMRYGVVAPKGHVIVAADLAQIEARLTAWLAQQLDLLEQFRQGRDVYSEFATRVYNRPITKENKVERFVGKTSILGLGFGMGPPKFRATLAKDDIRIELTESVRVVSAYRNTYYRIPLMWKYLDECLNVMTGGGKQYLRCVMLARKAVILPNGMPLIYHDLSNNGSGWAYSHGGITKTLWGGKMAENIVQALARIIIMEQMLAIYKELKLRPVLQVHDELVYVIPKPDAPAASDTMGQIMSMPPEWAPDLPVAVEINSGHSYGECK
jgi:DNA polymerase